VTRTSIEPLGDSLLRLSVGDTISEETSELVAARARLIREARLDGVTDIVASYTTLGIHYDPLAIAFEDLRDRIAAMMEEIPETASSEEPVVREIAVRYDGEDLDEVARRTSLSTTEVIEIHCGIEYRVFVVGFVPGFAYLGTLDEKLAHPRRDTPRKRVPPGSVAIAERQTGIYPSATPGGWHIIGTTSEKMFDASRERPALLRVGDRVRFVR
jgi:KipI family sensor histidine kinase inhibitor